MVVMRALDSRLHLGFARVVRALAIAVIGALVACTSERSSGGTSERAVADTSGVSVAGARSGPRGAARRGYVGLQYDSLPGDFTFEGGTVIPPAAPSHAEYDFSYVRTPRGDMIWLDTLGVPAGRGLRARIVRGTLVIPPLARDERLFMASCDVRGRFDPRVVAIVVNEPRVSRFTKIRQAWRVDLPTGRFDIIPISDIVCEEPGSG